MHSLAIFYSLFLMTLADNVVPFDAVQLMSFTPLKSVSDEYVCAMGIAPWSVFTTRKIQKCVSACTRNPTACDGVNYYEATSTCGLFDDDQVYYVVQPGCKFYTVCRLLFSPYMCCKIGADNHLRRVLLCAASCRRR